MGKFAKIVGKLEFEIKGEKISLVPKMGDNRKLLGLMNDNKLEEKDKMNKIFDFIVEVMIKNHTKDDDQTQEEFEDEIRTAVEFNMNDFMREFLIGFGWTTREKWDKLEDTTEKKLMSGN